MKKKTIHLCFVGVVLIVLMSGCAAPVVVSTPTPTNTPINTSTPTPTNTPTLVPTNTPTVTMTPTPTPEYTRLGKEVNKVVDHLIGWEIVLCGEDVVAEDEYNGIFLYRVDTQEYFCNLKGHMEEPITGTEPRYFLAFGRLKGYSEYIVKAPDGLHFYILGNPKRRYGYLEYPTRYDRDELYRISCPFSSDSWEERFEKYNHVIGDIKIWPLTKDEFFSLKEAGFVFFEFGH